MEVADDGRVHSNLLLRAEHQFAGGYHRSMPGHTAECLEEGMKMCKNLTDI